MTFSTQAAAEEHLKAEGYRFNGEYWLKRGRVDPACGGYEQTFLVSIKRQYVAPQYNAPDYFTLWSH